MTLNNDQNNIYIRIDDNRKIYTNKEYDITIIEMRPKERKKYIEFIELDMNIFNQNDNIYNENIYILQYPGINFVEQKSSVSFGILEEIQDVYELKLLCSTKPGSSGSPILNLLNHKVIGVHKAYLRPDKYNIGTFLKYPIEQYLGNINLIKKINNENKEEVIGTESKIYDIDLFSGTHKYFNYRFLTDYKDHYDLFTDYGEAVFQFVTQ